MVNTAESRKSMFVASMYSRDSALFTIDSITLKVTDLSPSGFNEAQKSQQKSNIQRYKEKVFVLDCS